ncbi:unnamed protein product [Peniophora sp. CBMAI 1063]|nr:unnamed protein product [Peniophora sp. CBMAI 1063]
MATSPARDLLQRLRVQEVPRENGAGKCMDKPPLSDDLDTRHPSRRIMSFEYNDLTHFFPSTTQAQIRDDFKSRCVLCTTRLGPNEGIYVPVLRDPRMWGVCVNYLLARTCDVQGASNGILSCDMCCKFLATPDGDDLEQLSILVPCVPILVYVDNILRSLRDKPLESRQQTFDEILEDLEKDQSSTPERRAAAPFLHCFQIHPIDHLDPGYSQEFALISLHGPPPVSIINDKSYRFIDPAVDGPSNSNDEHPTETLKISIYGHDNVVNLWRIPRRSAGSFMARAASEYPYPLGDPELYKYMSSTSGLSYYRNRGLRPEDVPKLPSVREQFNLLEHDILLRSSG